MKKFLNIIGYLLRKTYKYNKNCQQPNWKYVYYFFYQRILFFNFHIPWTVHPTSYITNYKKIKFGKNSAPGSAPNQYIQGENGIIFGNDVWIGPHVSIISANHDTNNFSEHKTDKPIKIGNNVWIGANSVILPTVTIGNNVVIGAGSIVTKDIPANSIAVGNPCKVIKEKHEI